MGFCADSQKGHHDQHVAVKGHPIFVNIKMTPKVQAANGEENVQTITKLAIGKPGGIDADTDKYDTSVEVACRECNTNLERTHPKVASLVDSILLAQSAYNQGAVSEWELELNTCPHTVNMD